MLCYCSVTAVGSERLPFLSINNALAPLVFSHPLLFSVSSLSSPPSASTMGKNNKRKREPTPPSEEFGDSEYSEEEFSSEFEGSPACVSRLMTQTTPRGLRRRSGRTSGPSSAPGSRARMSLSSPRTKMTTTTTATTTTVETAAVTAATAAEAAAARAAPEAAAARAAAARPVAKRHWSLDISIV
jgi:hypothetical protein